jgi:hypothetical protein
MPDTDHAQSPPPPPELARLDFLVGDWSNTGQVFPGPFGPGGPVTGQSEYRRELGGAWLMYVSRLHLPGLGRYEVQGGATFDRAAGKYRAYAANNLGVLIAYDGAWDDEARLVFTAAYPPSPNGARVIYQKLPDGSVKFISERSVNGGPFEAYFETTLARA